MSDPRFEYMPNGDLKIKKITQDSAGEYTCSASNNQGSDAALGKLSVVDETTIEFGPKDVTSQIRSAVTMNCSVLYNPALTVTITWKKDNRDVKFSDRVKLGQDNELIIDNLEFSDAGKTGCFHYMQIEGKQGISEVI